MKKKNFLIFILLILIGFIVYGNALKNEFVWDDIVYIVNNPHITSLKYIKEAFLFPLGCFSEGSDREISFYRPLQTISLIIDYFLWGKTPFGYHLTNILFHIAASLLIYLFVFKLSADKLISFMASLIFLIHPAQAAAVTYISGRADPMLFLFMLAALIFYIKSGENKGIKKTVYYIFSLFSFVLALLSKEMALVFPVILVFYDFWKSKIKIRQVAYLKYVPYLALIIVMVLLRHKVTTYTESQYLPIAQKLMMFGYIPLKYIKLLFFPVGLHMEYAVPAQHEIVIFTSIALVAAFSFMVYLKRQRFRFIYFGFAWFIITLFPMLNIIRKLNAPMAEHWLYVPILGFGIIIGSLLSILKAGISKRCPRGISLFLLSVIILGITVYYSSITILRNFDWKDNFTIFRKTLEYSPNSERVAMNLGVEYYKIGDFKNAEAYFKKAIAIDPGLKGAHYNFALMYEKMGNVESAIQEYKNEISVYPENIMALNNLGTLYTKTKNFELAIEQFNKMIEIDPDNSIAYYNLGIALEKAGQIDRALEK